MRIPLTTGEASDQPSNGVEEGINEQSTVLESTSTQAASTIGTRAIQDTNVSRGGIPLNKGITNITQSPVAPIPKMVEEILCPICYTDAKGEGEALLLPHEGNDGDKHQICNTCLPKIIAQTNPKCPCCRIKITQENSSLLRAQAVAAQEQNERERQLIQVMEKEIGLSARQVIELARGPISQQCRERAVLDTTELNYFDLEVIERIMRALLDGGPISERIRSLAAEKATEIRDIHDFDSFHFHRGVVNMLLENGEIGQLTRNKIAERAAKKGHFDTVILAFANGPIQAESRGEILKSAAWQGRLDMIPLLADGVSQSVRYQAIANAVMRGHWDVAQEIRSTL